MNKESYIVDNRERKNLNSVIKTIIERRSIRKFRPEQITDEELNLILTTGSYAPCAGGRQSPTFVVLQNKAMIEKLGKINKNSFFQAHPEKLNITVSKEQPSIIDDTAIQSAFYGAPTVVTVFAPKAYPYGEQDGSIVIENMLIAAHSLGIGSCFIARAADTFASEEGQRILKEWEVSEDYVAIAHCILGYPAGVYPEAKPRKNFLVKKIV